MNIRKFFLVVAALFTAAVSDAQDDGMRNRLEKHLYYLASDSLQGRKSGTPENSRARVYIQLRWEEMGIEPFFEGGFKDEFYAVGLGMCNLVGVIPGNDPVLKDEYILLGAHFDHIGLKGDEVCNGADDNASGSSALIEIARLLKENQSSLKRSVIIAAFDGEELGLHGSQHLADRMSQEGLIDRVKCMMSLDMVGWYAKNGKLELLGAGTMKDGRKILEDNAQGLNLKIGNFETAVLTATDTRSFAQNYKVPTLHVYTGLKSPYHKPADDAELIDYEGLEDISRYISRVTEDMASNPDFGPSGKIATIHTGKNKPFEIAVSGGFDVSSIDFPKVALNVNGDFGWTAGLTAQYNRKAMGYRIGAFYETSKARFPNESDLFGSTLSYKQSAIDVPLTFMLETNDPTFRLYFGIGANARFVLDSSLENLDYSTDDFQWGTHFLFGIKIGHFFLEDCWFSQANNLFDGPEAVPKANLSTTSCKIGWIF